MRRYLYKTRPRVMVNGGMTHTTYVNKLTWLGWLYFLPSRIVEALRLT